MAYITVKMRVKNLDYWNLIVHCDSPAQQAEMREKIQALLDEYKAQQATPHTEFEKR